MEWHFRHTLCPHGGIVEDGHGNILLVKARDDGWVYPGGITDNAVVGELATSDETTECRWVPNENVLEFIPLPAIRLRLKLF